MTNRGRLPLWLARARCPTGQVTACVAAIFGDDHRPYPGETTAFPRSWSALGAYLPGWYFAVGYVFLAGGSFPYSHTGAISVEPASP